MRRLTAADRTDPSRAFPLERSLLNADGRDQIEGASDRDEERGLTQSAGQAAILQSRQQPQRAREVLSHGSQNPFLCHVWRRPLAETKVVLRYFMIGKISGLRKGESIVGSTLARRVVRSSGSLRLALTAFVSAGVVVALGGSAAYAAASPPVNGALPVINGTERQAQSLSTTTGSWGGRAPISFAYQWLRCGSSGASCSSISSASSTTYKLVSSDVGHTLRVRVTATNPDGVAGVLSAPTAVIATLGSAPANSKQPDPSGTAKEGSIVSVNNGSWTGAQPVTYSYQWQRCTPAKGVCTNIAGATGQTHTVASADVGYILRAAVTAANAIGKTTAFSNVTTVVAPKDQAPSNVTPPIIAGLPAVGHTLVAASGTWKGGSGSFSYQWLRCNASGANCTDLPGATAQSYTVTSSDVGSALSVRVRASNNVGSASATSASRDSRHRWRLQVGASDLTRRASRSPAYQHDSLLAVPVPHPQRRHHRPLQSDSRRHKERRQRRTRQRRRHPLQLDHSAARANDRYRRLGHLSPPNYPPNAAQARRGPRDASQSTRTRQQRCRHPRRHLHPPPRPAATRRRALAPQ